MPVKRSFNPPKGDAAHRLRTTAVVSLKSV